MTSRRLVVAAALSLLPLLVAAAAWYWLTPEESANSPRARRLILLGIATPPQAPPMAARWALGLLPPLVLTLPVLPIVVVGRGLGRLHREDYSSGVALLGVIVCAAAGGLAVMWELERAAPLFPPGVPEAVGRAWSFVVPLATAGALGAAGVSAARRRRRDRARRRVWACPACGYDLRGSPRLCPECGRRYVPTGPPARV
jgi:hypothetical protein